MVYCIVPFCTSNSLKNTVSFHEVPADPTRRKKWTIAISREGSIKGSLWNPKERDAVCEKHFLPSDYKVGCKRKVLKKDAIPSVFSLYPKYMSPEVSAVRRELFKHALSKQCETSVQSPQLSVGNRPVKSETCVQSPQLSVSNRPVQSVASVQSSQPSVSNRPVQSEASVQSHPSASNRPIQNEASIQSPQPSVSNSPVQSKIPLQPSATDEFYSIYRRNVALKYMLLRKKFRRLTVTLSKTKKKLNILRMNKKELSRENKKLKKVLNERHILNDIELDAHLCHTDAAFLLDQINARKYKTPRWSEITIKQCILWHRYSPCGYRYIRSTSMMKLPSVSTLKKYIEYESAEKEIVTRKEN